MNLGGNIETVVPSHTYSRLRFDDAADQAGRLIMGKLVFDTMRGIDFLQSRSDIDADRIGVAGNSLGGAKATWMLALDTRLKLALVSGWAVSDYRTQTGKFCTRIPNQRLRERCDWPEFLSLAAPHCAVLFLNGDADTIIDREGDGTASECGCADKVTSGEVVHILFWAGCGERDRLSISMQRVFSGPWLTACHRGPASRRARYRPVHIH